MPYGVATPIFDRWATRFGTPFLSFRVRMRCSSLASGFTPRVSSLASSMKLAYRSPIFCSSVPAFLPASFCAASMISRRWAWASSRSCMKVPQLALSAGISVDFSHLPFR